MVAGQCTACGEKLADYERSGRLGGVLTLLVAAILILAALGFDEWVQPPIWVHALIWAPLTIGAVLFALRLYKTIGVYREFEKKRAAPVRREPRE